MLFDVEEGVPIQVDVELRTDHGAGGRCVLIDFPDGGIVDFPVVHEHMLVARCEKPILRSKFGFYYEVGEMAKMPLVPEQHDVARKKVVGQKTHRP